MKFAISAAALILVLGTTASVQARQDKGQEDHSKDQHQKAARPAEQHAQPAQQQQTQQARPAQQQHAQQHIQQQAKPAEQHAQQQARPAQQQHVQQQAKPEQHAQQHAQQQDRAVQQQHTQQVSRSQQQQTHSVDRGQQTNDGRNASHVQQLQRDNGNRGNYTHGRISDDHYASNFGSEHRFHVNRREYDDRRFYYGGYSFGFVDPWPVEWGYDDDVYVVYADDGYYMYDRVHPGVRISINMF
jgi:hypothetical protein